MFKKKLVLCVAVVSVIMAGILSACGKKSDTQEGKNADETKDESSFGLKDYEGLYCMTATDEIEGFEVTYTYGYLLNGDGTGVSFGQDDVDFTWNETEIIFADSTRSFAIESDKLTVDGVTYDKIEGNFIAPNKCNVDTDNIADGIYYAYIDKDGISESDGKVVVKAEIYTEDSYDIVDVNKMAKGDVIYINGRLLPVDSIEKTDWGVINVNGGIEEMGSALIADEESNCFVFAGMDMERSFTCHGISTLDISDDMKFIDNSEPSEVIENTGSDAVRALKAFVDKYPLTCYDAKITIEQGAIVEIYRMYRP